jgi:hypothetical protein
MLDLLSVKPIFLISGGLMISARWWPGLERVSTPTTRGVGLVGVPEGRGTLAPVRNYIYSYVSSIRDVCLCMFVFLYFHSNVNKTYYSV